MKLIAIILGGIALLPIAAYAQQSQRREAPQAEQSKSPATGQSGTIPGTGGYGVLGGLPSVPGNNKPDKGGYLGIQYPPNTPTTVKCTRNGKEVPC